MTQTSYNFGQALATNLISKPEYLQKVYNTWQAGRYNTLNQLIDGLNTGNDKRRVEQVRFNTGRQSYVGVTALVQGTPSLSGSLLTIPLNLGVNDPNNFREGDTVIDNNYTYAIVKSKTANTITVQGIDQTLNTSTTFGNGYTVAVVGNAQKSKGSVGRETLYNVPTNRYNYTQIMRGTVSMFRRDNIGTWYTTSDGSMWSHTQIDEEIKRVKRNEELSAYFGKRGIIDGADANDPAAITFTGGIRWSIINEGGMYESLTQAIDEDTFHDAILRFADRRGTSTDNVIALMGSDFLATLESTITKDYIKQAGDKNTFGGVSVRGLNVMEYGFVGQNIKFVVWDGFQNPDYDTMISSITGRKKLSHSCLLMDTTPVSSPAGGSMPVIINTYFGDNEYLGGFTKGFIEDPSELMGRGQLGSMNYMNGGFVTDTDAWAFNIYCDRGFHVHADNMMLFELAS